MRGRLFVVGVSLIASFGCVLVAALPPAVGPAYSGSVERGLLVAAQERGTWIVACLAFAAAMVLLLIGLATLSSVLRAQVPDSAVPDVALALITVGTVLWVAAQTFRLTTMLRVADLFAATRAVPDWYPPLRFWADDGLLNAMTFTAGPAVVLYGVIVARRGVLAAWTGWLAVALAVLTMAEYFLMNGVIPATLHLAVVFMGANALFRAHRLETPSRVAG